MPERLLLVLLLVVPLVTWAAVQVLVPAVGYGATLGLAGLLAVLYAVRVLRGRQSEIERWRVGRAPASPRQSQIEGRVLAGLGAVLLAGGTVVAVAER